MTVRGLTCVAVSVAVTIAGCGKRETKKQHHERQKARTEILSTLGATHDSIVALADASNSFGLVSRPKTESSRPEKILIRRDWVLASFGQPPSKQDMASLIASCESVLKKHVASQTDTDNAKLKYDFEVSDEEERVRIRVVATWNRASR